MKAQAKKLYLQDVLTIGKTIPKEKYLLALKILCDKEKVNPKLNLQGLNNIVSIRRYDKHMIVTSVKQSNYESFHYLKEFTSYYKNDQYLQDAIEKVYETYKPLSFEESKERFDRLCENKTLYL